MFRKLIERIKSLFRRRPLTADELAARAEAESAGAEAAQEIGEIRAETYQREGPSL